MSIHTPTHVYDTSEQDTRPKPIRTYKKRASVGPPSSVKPQPTDGKLKSTAHSKAEASVLSSASANVSNGNKKEAQKKQDVPDSVSQKAALEVELRMLTSSVSTVALNARSSSTTASKSGDKPSGGRKTANSSAATAATTVPSSADTSNPTSNGNRGTSVKSKAASTGKLGPSLPISHPPPVVASQQRNDVSQIAKAGQGVVKMPSSQDLHAGDEVELTRHFPTREDYLRDSVQRAEDRKELQLAMDNVRMFEEFCAIMHGRCLPPHLPMLFFRRVSGDFGSFAEVCNRIRTVSEKNGTHGKCSEHHWSTEELAFVIYGDV